MKLLFDENLSPKLARLLATLFPSSTHVREVRLLGLPDEEVWEVCARRLARRDEWPPGPPASRL